MPGGVCRDLSAKALLEIKRRWPSLDLEAINSAAKNYQIRLQHNAETPRNLRGTMDEVVQLASQLRVRLLTLSEEAEDHIWNDFYSSRQGDLIEALPSLLSKLQHAAMQGHNAEIGKDGRKRLGPRHKLIAAIAWELQQAGLKIDKRPMGDLRRVTEIVLGDLDERPAT